MNKFTYLRTFLSGTLFASLLFLAACSKPAVITISPEQEAYAQKSGNPVTLTNTIGMVFRLIPPGKFQMGAPKDEAGYDEFERRHLVEMKWPFYMQASEVTQAQYERVMGENPSYFQNRSGEKPEMAQVRPVDTVSWFDCIKFCNKLSQLEGLEPAYSEQNSSWVCDPASSGYRLPFEAEWEYVARAGSSNAFHFGSNRPKPAAESAMNKTAWWKANSENVSHQVMTKDSNPWGVHDMLGNLTEWCWDWFDSYPRGRFTREELVGPNDRRYGRVARGGWCMDGLDSLRVAKRSAKEPTEKINRNGFRVVRNISAP